MRRWPIIGLGLLLALTLGACSALRFVYNQGPQWVYWWLDGYADFQDEQVPRVEAVLQQWFAWHRRTQLGEYAALLERARNEVQRDTTPAQVCAWWDVLEKRRTEAVDAAIPGLASVAQMLQPAQLRHIEREMADTLEELRDDYLQDDPRERQKAALKRTVDRIETFYGRLDAPQRSYVARMVGASPWQPERWLADREQLHRDTLAMLREATQPGQTPAQVQALVRNWADRGLRVTGDEATRRYQDAVKTYNCQFAADLHNLTTPAQRKSAQGKLDGWRQDLLSLAAPG